MATAGFEVDAQCRRDTFSSTAVSICFMTDSRPAPAVAEPDAARQRLQHPATVERKSSVAKRVATETQIDVSQDTLAATRDARKHSEAGAASVIYAVADDCARRQTSYFNSTEGNEFQYAPLSGPHEAGILFKQVARARAVFERLESMHMLDDEMLRNGILVATQVIFFPIIIQI